MPKRSPERENEIRFRIEGCVACGYEGPCVRKDDVEKIRSSLLSSDMDAVLRR